QMAATGDLKVAPNGNYILATATATGGAREFTPQGAFVRQFGTGTMASAVIVPGNRLWTGGRNTTINIFDLDTSSQVDSFTLDHQATAVSMQYSALTNTVLMADLDAGSAFERDLDGIRLRRFQIPRAQTFCYSVTRGPDAEVFATASGDLD